jgi:formylglycine-generating enzyme required for sulfatase activity
MENEMITRRILHASSVILIFTTQLWAQPIEITDLEWKLEKTQFGGSRIAISYQLKDTMVNPAEPAYVFLRLSPDSGSTWTLVSPRDLVGNGHGIITRAGKKQSVLWGARDLGLEVADGLVMRVGSLRMVRIPAGSFRMETTPGAGYDDSKIDAIVTSLGEFFIAKYETSLSLYTEYLNEMGRSGAGWQEKMANPDRCGILRSGEKGAYEYEVIPGREDHPVNYASWYDARAFLAWCGLRLPTEAEWEKAARGGDYLDGAPQTMRNPNPERAFVWGDQLPDEGGTFRCNYSGTEDGFEYTSPAGSFADFSSPYGVCDMAGNVAEWTLDTYTTSYHEGLDGYRVVRGGSYMAVPIACDTISGATAAPVKESSIIGFRGVYELGSSVVGH